MYSLGISQMPECSMFGRMRQKNGWNLKGVRAAPANIFVMMIGGEAEFCLEGQFHTVSTGDILIIPTGTAYYADTRDFCEYYFFHFSGKIAPESDVMFPNGYDHSFSFQLPARARDKVYFELKIRDSDLFRRIHADVIACVEYNTQGTYTGRLLLDAIFYKIILIIGSLAESRSARFPPALEKMLVHIRKNLTEPLKLSDICKECGVTAAYAARLFRQYFHMTATEYINSVKLYYACELLRNTNMNISETAFYLGYSDVSYFSKRFKKLFGRSPGEYFEFREKRRFLHRDHNEKLQN